MPGAAERQKTLAAQDGKCALCGCGLTAGACELDHVVPVRQAFAGSAQTLQALCGDCHSERTLRESAQPISPRSHGVQAVPQGRSVRWRGRGPGLCGGLLRREAVLPEFVAVRGAGWYPKVSLAATLDLGVCRWDHIALGISARSHVDAATLRARSTWPSSARDDRPVGAQHGGSSSSKLDGAGADFSQAFAYEGGMVWGFVYASEQRRLPSHP